MRWPVVLCVLVACSDDGVPLTPTSSGAESSPATSDGDAGDSMTTSPSASGSMTSVDTTDPGTTGTGGPPDASSGTGFGSESSGEPDTGTTSGTGTTTGTTTGTGSTGSSSSGGLGDGAIGEDCIADNECSTGVCWDYADYDPFCGGAVCSIACAGDDDCVKAFENAGADTPDAASCGGDGRCDPRGTGFGLFFCF